MRGQVCSYYAIIIQYKGGYFIMRLLINSLLIMVIVTLSACNSSDQIKPINKETIDFDMQTAIEMVEKKERLIIDIALRDSLSKLEYEQAEKALTEEFGNYGKDILMMLTINDMDSISDTHIINDTFYPTVFHEGITITTAVINNIYYENEFFNVSQLSIREAYSGDDEKLKDWYREYIFIPDDVGGWKFHGFSGVLNFMDEHYHMNYLKLDQ